jgi:hypothetical protein
VNTSLIAQRGALVAAGTGAVGIYYEYMPLVIAATVVATISIFGWVRMTAPHDHWAGMRRRRPSDP